MPSLANKCELDYQVESTWDPRYLKAKCKELGLESEFQAYQTRLLRSYVGVFCVLHISVTVIHCILISVLSEHKKYIYLDIGVYTGSCVVLVLILSINFWEGLTERHPWIMFVSSALACLTLVIADLTHDMYHNFYHQWHLCSFYDTYIVCMIYLFLPIVCLSGAILVGALVSVMYIVIYLNVTFSLLNDREYSFVDTSIEINHYACINLLGIYYRVIHEMVVRSSFIERHQYIKEELSLRNAQRQEKLLLDNIMPTQFSEILQKDIKKRIVLSTRFSSTPIRNFNAFKRSMAIQTHSDVSILYADVVNYTHLTTTLTVEQLVTTLHDLYARFDLAAQCYSVQRIKFLGDCYYCVAGLADADPDHANNAVALGIAMITHIQKVRDMKGFDINMRIGVHSGSLYAGVIGEAKLQYDVWGEQLSLNPRGLLTTTFRVPLGPDVTIANVLESTGVPGAVHISGSAMRNLTSGDYTIKEGPEKARMNPVLQKYRISTYLIIATPSDIEVDSISLDLRTFLSTGTQNESHLTENLSTVLHEELREEYLKMPIIRFDFKTLCRNKWRHPLNKKMDCCLTFDDSDLEKAYLKQTDYIFKYHILLAWFMCACLVYVQIMNSSFPCIHCFVVDFLVLLILTGLVVIAWFKQICWMIYSQKDPPRTYNCISCTIFRTHEKIQETLSARICVYLLIIILNWVLIVFITMTCDYEEFILQYIEERIYHYKADHLICFHPWMSTDMMALMIFLAFTFSHIPFLLKIFVSAGHLVIYLILIFMQYDFVFHHSTTTNPFFPSEFAHGFLIITTFSIMYLKARQTEFLKKVNYNWFVELEKKRDGSKITNRSIIILLNNILPNHVVDIYINSLSRNQLYYEKYKMVSVMFAMLENFEMDIHSLRILNEVITQFDVMLLYYKEYYVVEKIKIVNCTYMAACGLDVNFAGATSKPLRPGSLNEEKHQGTNEGQDEVVFVMASFALDLMRTLASCNDAYNGIIKDQEIIDGMITIGISSGEIMAGIVGASKPHYDIWGDPVNMAARMETTGRSGHIQVTEESATILRTFGIQANYRGQTFVKGRGLLPTYFLGIDKNYNFIRVKETRTPSHSHRSESICMENTYTT